MRSIMAASVVIVAAPRLSRLPPSAGTRRRRRRSRLRCSPDSTSTSPQIAAASDRRISNVRALFGTNTTHSSRTRCTAATGTVTTSAPAVANRQPRARRHAGTQQPVAVAQARCAPGPCATPLDLARRLRHGAGEGLAGKRREGDPRRRAALDAHGVALERVHRQPERRRDRRCGTPRVPGSSICPRTSVRSITVPAIGARSEKAANDVSRRRLVGDGRHRRPASAAAGARSAARAWPQPPPPPPALRAAGRSVRPQGALALERRLASVTRASAARYSARARPSSGLVQFGEHLPGAHRIAGTGEQPRDARGDRRADFRVGAFVNRELAEERHLSPPALDSTFVRGQPQVAQHRLIDFDRVRVWRCLRRGLARCRPASAGRAFSAPRPQLHAQHEQNVSSRHRKTPALASRSARASAASRSASRY